MIHATIFNNLLMCHPKTKEATANSGFANINYVYFLIIF